jgi:uncharacterized membrane protein YedE/YeeE
LSARVKTVSVGFGIAFGLLLAWSGLADPDVIRRGLLLDSAYMYLVLGSAVVVGIAGTRILQRRRAHALLTGDEVACTVDRPQRRHVTGSILFGIGWAIACVCPGPVAVQVGSGVLWALLPLAGMAIGVRLFFVLDERSGRAAEGARVPAGAALASNPD